MIKFQNVSLIYPTAERTILDKLNFEIGEGEFVLLIGETGIGKSSVLRLINGLVPHHTGGILAGSVEVGGISTRTVRPGQLAELIGIVGQNPINGFVTDIVEDELAFSMEALNLPEETMRKRIEEVIDLLSLNQIRNRKIATLSGGEQQRVAIAAAMVLHPKILVLDIETSPIISHVWGLWDNNVSLNQVQTDWHLLSWAAKWLGEKEIMYCDQRGHHDISDDDDLLSGLHDDLLIVLLIGLSDQSSEKVIRVLVDLHDLLLLLGASLDTAALLLGLIRLGASALALRVVCIFKVNGVNSNVELTCFL